MQKDARHESTLNISWFNVRTLNQLWFSADCLHRFNHQIPSATVCNSGWTTGGSWCVSSWCSSWWAKVCASWRLSRASVSCSLALLQPTAQQAYGVPWSSSTWMIKNFMSVLNLEFFFSIQPDVSTFLFYFFCQFLLWENWPGRVAQSVGQLTRRSGVLGSIPGLATYFRFSFRFFKKGSCQLLAKVCARSTG